MIYPRLPMLVKIVFFIINTAIPDPIPVIDEALMGVGIISKTKIASNIFFWFKYHGWKIKVLIITILFLAIGGFVFLLSGSIFGSFFNH
ncbi:MAG: hypothetical protein ACRC5H_09205 [Treponemataceae bacterium]